MSADRLSRLLEAERGVRLSSDEVERSRQALHRALRVGRKAWPIAVGPLTMGLYSVVAKAAVIVVAAGTTVGISLAVREVAQPYPTATTRKEPPLAKPRPSAAFQSRQEPLMVPVTPSAPALSAPALSAPALSAPLPASNPSTLETASPKDTLGHELTLLRQAKQLLDRRDFEGARATLEEHRVRYPAGLVVLEREALTTILDCSVGTSPAALTHARRYLAEHPRSIHAAAIARACRLELTGLGPVPPSASSQASTQAFPLDD